MKVGNYLIGGVMAMAILVVGAASAFAADGEKTFPADFEERKAEMEAKRAEMNQIFEDGDYQAWYDLISEKNSDAQVLEVVNADNFDEFAGAHLQIEEGMETLKEMGIKGTGHMGEMGPHKFSKRMLKEGVQQ